MILFGGIYECGFVKTYVTLLFCIKARSVTLIGNLALICIQSKDVNKTGHYSCHLHLVMVWSTHSIQRTIRRPVSVNVLIH